MSEKALPFNVQLLSPKFWPTWIGLGVLRLLHSLPHKYRLKSGKWLGRLLKFTQKRRVQITQKNLEACFPSMSMIERDNLLDAHFEALGMALIEGAMSWWSSDQEIRKYAEFEGLEHLEHALATGRGVILLTGHFTSMELAGHILATEISMGAMYRPLKNKVMDWLVLHSRESRLFPVFPRNDIRSMMHTLKQGKAIWYGYDQDYGKRHSVFVPFFGVPAATITTTSRFAANTDALIVPFFPYRLSDGSYRIEILPALENFPSKDVKFDTERLNSLLEAAILKAPEQYLWIHRRFKTRPIDEPPVYGD